MEIPEMKLILAKLERLENMTTFIATAGKVVVDVNDIAKLEGSSYSAIMHGKDIYLLPRFGQSAYPTGKKRWPIEEYLAWRDIPPQERQDMYREYLRNGAQLLLDEKRGRRRG